MRAISKSGKAIVARIPPERMLTETDGPFSKANSRTTVPSDVEVVEKYLGILWGRITFRSAGVPFDRTKHSWSGISRI